MMEAVRDTVDGLRRRNEGRLESCEKHRRRKRQDSMASESRSL